MRNLVTWFEIPVSNLDRAVEFYQTVFGVTLWRDVVAGIPHAIFPVDEGTSTGALVTHAPTQPGPSGVVVYLSCDSVATSLERVRAAGGEVVMPPTALDKIGTIAAIRDLDHNTIGLHGRN
jgi:predicted enzyme related to lactoylglutathione lyase